VGLEEPREVNPAESPVQRRHLARTPQRPLEAGGRQLTAAEDAVADDRVADPQPPPEALRIVVGQLVSHREAPHLQGVERRIAGLGAGLQHRQPEGAGDAGGDRDDGVHTQTATEERDEHRRREGGHRAGAHGRAKRRAGAMSVAKPAQGG
jgi:hypothetical protein